jgi:hypothetical protein
LSLFVFYKFIDCVNLDGGMFVVVRFDTVTSDFKNESTHGHGKPQENLNFGTPENNPIYPLDSFFQKSSLL